VLCGQGSESAEKADTGDPYLQSKLLSEPVPVVSCSLPIRRDHCSRLFAGGEEGGEPGDCSESAGDVRSEHTVSGV